MVEELSLHECPAYEYPGQIIQIVSRGKRHAGLEVSDVCHVAPSWPDEETSDMARARHQSFLVRVAVVMAGKCHFLTFDNLPALLVGNDRPK